MQDERTSVQDVPKQRVQGAELNVVVKYLCPSVAITFASSKNNRNQGRVVLRKEK